MALFHMRIFCTFRIKLKRYMKYLLTLMVTSLLINTNNTYAQKGKIKGVITYFFNDYQGSKPDLGAEVYVVDSSKCSKYDSEISFQFELASIKDDKSDEFKALDTKNALNNKEITGNEDANKATVDAAGNYAFDLPPATYYVLVKSKGRTGLSVTEIMGKVYIIKIRLKPDQIKDISYNFPLK